MGDTTTNEELVQLIRDGRKDLIPQLWDQVYLFICKMAKKRLIRETEYTKQLEDDLVNESYFDFLLAIDGYKPDSEASFLHYLTYHLKNSFNRALGVRTQKDKRDPMHSAVRLDAPIEGTEDLTFQDMIVDHMAEEQYRFIENEDFWRDVHDLLEEAIYSVTSREVQEVFLIMLHENCNAAEACRRAEVPEERRKSAYSMHTTGLWNIRRYLRGRARKRCRQVGIDEYFSMGLQGSGLSAYRRNVFTSSTEMAAIRLADGETWSKKIMECKWQP